MVILPGNSGLVWAPDSWNNSFFVVFTDRFLFPLFMFCDSLLLFVVAFVSCFLWS